MNAIDARLPSLEIFPQQEALLAYLNRVIGHVIAVAMSTGKKEILVICAIPLSRKSVSQMKCEMESVVVLMKDKKGMLSGYDINKRGALLLKSTHGNRVATAKAEIDEDGYDDYGQKKKVSILNFENALFTNVWLTF